MITIPVYELLLLPEVTFFFKKDMFPEGRIKEERNSPRGNFHGKYFSSGRDGNH